MTIGAEKKKVAILIGLLALAGTLFYVQFGASDAPATAPPAPERKTPAARAIRADDLLGPAAARGRGAARSSNDFKPVLKQSKPGEGPDPMQLDPTLRTDLLAKVRSVNYEGVERNLFQFGAAQPKPSPLQIEQAKKQAAEAAKALAASTDPPKPAEPPAPPVNLKYYGYATRPGDVHRRAFLIDGEDIIVAAEGEVVSKRYKVVRIGITSMVVEDLQFKNHQTTLPLQETAS